jgi:hypothetical protein
VRVPARFCPSLTPFFGSRACTAPAPPRPAMASPQPTLLQAVDLTPEAFAPFGEVVRPTVDGTPYGPPHDAALALPVSDCAHPPSGLPLSATPRLYIMSLPARRSLAFDRITFHARVSQCLAAFDAAWAPWYLAVAAPTGDVRVRGGGYEKS